MKNNKIKKNQENIIKNNNSEKKGCQDAKKWSKIGWEGLKIQRLKFDSILLTGESHVDKKNSIWEKKRSKIRCLWTQLNFIEGLIEFMESLIAI
jgi:hypothetical protein